VIDSHAHLGVCEPDEAELLDAARAAGVERILDVGMDEDSNRAAIAAAEADAAVFTAVGRHPNSATGFDEQAGADIERLAAHPRVRAIGETGLDFYRDYAPREDQERAFRAQIGIARRSDLPLVIHMRDSIEDAFALLDAEAHGVKVILHCFSGSTEQAASAAERGWLCSFAGNLTYPSAGDLRAAALEVPDELLLVETDSPFLSPQPLRGKPNQPAHVAETAGALAELRGIDYEELDRIVSANAERVFGW